MLQTRSAAEEVLNSAGFASLAWFGSLAWLGSLAWFASLVAFLSLAELGSFVEFGSIAWCAILAGFAALASIASVCFRTERADGFPSLASSGSLTWIVCSLITCFASEVEQERISLAVDRRLSDSAALEDIAGYTTARTDENDFGTL